MRSVLRRLLPAAMLAITVGGFVAAGSAMDLPFPPPDGTKPPLVADLPFPPPDGTNPPLVSLV